MIDESWIDQHPASEDQLVFPNSVEVEGAHDRLSDLLAAWAEAFALERFGALAPLRLGDRGLHPDEGASFLRAVDGGHVVVEDNGKFRSTNCRPKPGGGVYNLFTANTWNDDLHVSLNTEYLVHFGAATELVTEWGWSRDDVEVEVGEFDARCWADGRISLAMEAKARVDGQDGLASLLRSFLNFGSQDPPEPNDNHSRKYVELLTLTESGPVLLWLVAAGARWSFTATRHGDRITLAEADRPAPTITDSGSTARPPATPASHRGPNIDHAARIADHTESDTRQRVYEWNWTDESQLRDFVEELKPALLKADIEHTRPWVWVADTSGGPHQTHFGKDTGLELRLSYWV